MVIIYYRFDDAGELYVYKKENDEWFILGVCGEWNKLRVMTDIDKLKHY